jgi:hypothetical protein
MGRNGRRAIALLAIAGLGLVATACGGDDDDDAAPAASDDNGDGGDDGSDDGDAKISGDCKDALGDYLEKLEPFIEDIDWEDANPDTMTQIQEDMGDDLDDVDADLQKECGEFDFGANSGQLDAALDIAEDRAPGTVGFLTFLQSLSQAVADISLPDNITLPDSITLPDNVTLPDNITIPDITIPDITIPDITIPDITVPGAANAADLPTDCQGAIDYVHGLMDEYNTMLDMPVSEMTAIGTLSTTITSACSVNEMSEFYNDPDVTAWMSGT